MPIILKTEFRSFRTRLLIGAMYALLTVGGLTMLYPFLLMLSGSTKSNVDVYDFDIFPRYWHDDAMLYRKYVEEKCNERFREFSVNYGSQATAFKDVAPPPPARPELVRDWQEFITQPVPAGHYFLGASLSMDGGNVLPNLRSFRRHLQARCGGDVRVLRTRYGLNAANWLGVNVPYEPLTDRNYQLAASPFVEEFYRFKETRPPAERVFVSCDAAFHDYVSFQSRYKDGIAAYNHANGCNLASFAEVALEADCPSAPGLAEDWQGFVREGISPQFVKVDDRARPGFGRFLESRYKTIDALNSLFGGSGAATAYARFEDVPFPADRLRTSPLLNDYCDFLKDRDLLPADCLRLDTPEIRWRTFLERKYETPGRAAQAHGRAYERFATVPMPQAESDFRYCLENSRELRRHFLTRNFIMVFEFIWLYGRGISNTIIYCLLSILTALIVNPLAAYALSRGNLKAQYKILLFLIATMAFPPVVTMIPNFLLLKDLHLLNTFAALILPGMANGYAIFLLKGFFDSLPRELYEAAEIDGATEWHKFWLVTMALSKPILAVIALGAFVGAYSNFMMAFILCQDERMWTLMVWLFKLQGFASQGVVFASLLVAAVPTLIMFAFCQNLIIRGIVVPTEK